MRHLIILTALAIAACAPAESPDAATPAAPGESGPCDAAEVQDVIGKPATQVQEDARVRSGASTVRVYETGSPVTMDYRPDRLNLETDAGGTIVKVSCG